MNESLRVAISLGYLAILGVLAAFSLHRLWLLALLLRAPAPWPSPLEGEPPRVTVQLALYNEPGVAARTVDALAALDWPRERLDIQVLDDSTDETRTIVAARVESWRGRGISIEHVVRGSRDGFKAGALAHGLARARGELVAIFDADFAPEPDFLRRTVPAFADPRTGLVQARWEHANRSASLLTRLQAILLDSHFVVEQAARSRAGLPFKFNGTAGIWRRRAIEEAGGWSADTLTEDLDLSVRAQLAGWRFAFAGDVAVQGELPDDVGAFRSQQRRWVKGSAQAARKLLGRIWAREAALPLTFRLEATAQLLLNACYPLALGLALLTVPLVLAGAPRSHPHVGKLGAALFLAATASLGVCVAASQRRRGLAGVLEGVALLPPLMALGMGLSFANARAFAEGLLGTGESAFVRTPKRGQLPRASEAPGPPLLEVGAEVLLTLYFGWGTLLTLTGRKLLGSFPFQALLLLGFGAIGLKALTSSVKSKFPVTKSPT